jgi:hypothetical protein
MGRDRQGGGKMIYLGERWAEALNNYLCYKCFSRLVLSPAGPVCPLHGKTAWIHRSRRNLFASIRARMRRNNGHDEIRSLDNETEAQTGARKISTQEEG